MLTELLPVSMGTWDWIIDTIKGETAGINNMSYGISLIMKHNEIYDSLIGAIPEEMKSAIKGIALSLVVLFFLIDFIHRSMDLKWVTWENVMMFFAKLVLAKVFVDNAEWLMSCIFNGFNSLTNYTSDPNALQLIPTSDPVETYKYFLGSTDVAKLIDKPHIGIFDFTPVGLWLLTILQSFIMKAILTVTLIIVLARFMELAIYTIAAPIPLSTLGCDGLQDIGKSYLKSYAACCIHAMVILVIFASYGALNTAINGITEHLEVTIPIVNQKFSVDVNPFQAFGITGFMGLIKTFILGASVMKSEQWAKRICGAM